MSVRTTPIWLLRARREAPRYALAALAALGLASSARWTIAPPSRAVGTGAVAPTTDVASQAYAVLFARRYLSWRAGDSSEAGSSLTPFLGTALEPSGAPLPPPGGTQAVTWVEAVQVRPLGGAVRRYTIAAEVSGAGLLYLDVDVQRDAEGALQLVGYPAFVGPPQAAPAAPTHGTEVDDQQLVTVIDRALRNYLAGSAGDLSADLAPQARVALPVLPLALLTVQHIDWTRGHAAVLALVTAQDQRGAQYALEYEVGVEALQGRWEIGAIQANEDA